MNKKVLIVDDNKEIPEVLQRALKGVDIESQICYSAEEALEFLEKENILVIITDLWMPGLNGLELLQAIKAKNHYSIVFCMTGDPSMFSLSDALDYGAADFFVKATLDLEYIIQSVEFAFKKQANWRNIFPHFIKNK